MWVYTSSFRSRKYIQGLFLCYRVHFDEIVNGQRHLDEVQGNRKHTLPSKLPNKYRISLHIDDEDIVATCGKEYGFNVYHLNEPDDAWKEKILNRVYEIQRKEGF